MFQTAVRPCVVEKESSLTIHDFWSIAVVGKLFETVRRVEQLTDEMALPEDGADEHRNALKY
jgi:hypothetical protein